MKKFVAVLLLVVLAMSLSVSAFADAITLPFNPGKLYAEKVEEATVEEAEAEYLTFDEWLAQTDSNVLAINKAGYDVAPAAAYTVAFSVDADAGFAVRKVIANVKDEEGKPFIKTFYYDENGNVFYSVYETKAYERGEQFAFYYAVVGEGDVAKNELVFARLMPFPGKDVKNLKEGDEHFAEIETSTLAEAEEAYKVACDQLKFFQDAGMYVAK